MPSFNFAGALQNLISNYDDTSLFASYEYLHRLFPALLAGISEILNYFVVSMLQFRNILGYQLFVMFQFIFTAFTHVAKVLVNHRTIPQHQLRGMFSEECTHFTFPQFCRAKIEEV